MSEKEKQTLVSRLMEKDEEIAYEDTKEGLLRAEREIVATIHGPRIEKITSLEDLLSYVRSNHLHLYNSYDGIDHQEHLEKRILFAASNNAPEFVPEAAGLRLKVRQILEKRGSVIEKKGDHVLFRQFLKERLPDIELSDKEYENICKKLPLTHFLSIDVRAERAIVLANALDGAETSTSCTGHEFEGFDENSFHFGSAYVHFSLLPRRIVHAIIAEIEANDDLKSCVSIRTSEDKGILNLQFRQFPSAAHLKEKKLPNPLEIFQLSTARLERKLGQKANIACENFNDLQVKSYELFTWAKKVFNEQLKSAGVSDFIDLELRYKELIGQDGMNALLSHLYASYYTSKEALEKNNAFWHAIENVMVRFKGS